MSFCALQKLVPPNSNDAHLIMIDDDIGDELDHAASAASTGAAKEDDLLLPPPHQLLHSLPKRPEYYRKTGNISTWQACDP